MTGRTWLLWLCCLPASGVAAPLRAADPPAAAPSAQGTYLGILFLPSPSGTGVTVYHVLPESPAAHAGLRRDDVLLRYDDQTIRDCEHLVDLIRKDAPYRKVMLTLRRDGKELPVAVTLTLGPTLRYAQGGQAEPLANTGVAKPNGPAPVSVSAEPLGQGKMRVTVEYYDEKEGRWRTLTGDLDRVETTCQVLPPRERELVGVALRRLRTLNGDADAGKRAAPQR